MPIYNFWSSRAKDDRAMSLIMITYAWFLWIVNILFVLIILLNFLIAIISQSYDSVMTKSIEIVYESRAEFAAETNLL